MWLLVLAPPVVVLVGILNASPLPDLDYWYALERISDSNGLAIGADVLTLHSNEHLIPLAGLVYAANVALFGGSSVTLSLFAWVMGCLQLVILAALLPSWLKERRFERAVWWLVISLAVFTPAAHHNWLRGMSGVCWISANTFSVLAVYLVIKVWQRFSWRYLLGSIVAGYCAALSYSTGLLVWPLLGLIGVCSWWRDRRVLPTLMLAVAPLIALVILTAERPAHHGEAPRLAFEIASHGRFFLSLLGGVFDSPTFGALLLLLSLIAVGFIATKRGKRDHIAWPFLLLMLYPLLNALVSAIFRAEIRIDAAASSRYASLPSLFALFVSVSLLSVVSGRALSVARIAFPSLFIAAALFSYSSNKGEIFRQLSYQDRKDIAALSLELNLPDRELLTQTTMRDFERFTQLIPRLALMRHFPFDTEEGGCPRLGDTIESASIDQPREVKILDRKKVSGVDGKDVTRISGIVAPRVEAFDCIAIVNSANVVVGRAVPTILRFPRGDPKLSASSTRWGGYVLVPDDAARLSVVFVSEGRAEARSVVFDK